MKEKLSIWLAWRLPRRVAYWCAIRVTVNAFVRPPYDKEEVPDLKVTDALQRWA